MTLLSSIRHKLITESVVRTLKNNNVYNVLDFLQEDSERLVNITKLSYIEVVNLRRFLIDNYKASVYKGNECLHKNTYLKTGIDRLDDALEGGLPIGKITELCGLPGSRKTQLAFTICSKVASVLKCNVIYVDTKGDFSGTRIHEILKENHIGDEEMGVIMQRIKVIKVYNMNELISFFHELRRNEKLCKCVSVIIVDSLPSLMLQYQGESNNESLGLLNHFVNVARFIGEKFQMAILIINLYTRWIEISTNELEGEFNAQSCIKKRLPMLGKFWQHIPSLYINLEVKSDELLEAAVRKSYHFQTRNVSLNLGPNGVT